MCTAAKFLDVHGGLCEAGKEKRDGASWDGPGWHTKEEKPLKRGVDFY
jgi:hypothetical protein